MAEDPVAHQMTEGVVDFLEAVDVEEEHTDRRTPPVSAGQLPFEVGDRAPGRLVGDALDDPLLHLRP